MKVLLQDKKTGLFFISRDSWTESRAAARDFRTSASAIWTAQECTLQDAVVVFAIGSASNDVHVKIHEETLACMRPVAHGDGNGRHKRMRRERRPGTGRVSRLSRASSAD